MNRVLKKIENRKGGSMPKNEAVISITGKGSGYINNFALNLIGVKVGDRIEVATDGEVIAIAKAVKGSGFKLSGNNKTTQGCNFRASDIMKSGITTGRYYHEGERTPFEGGIYFIFQKPQ